MSNSLKVFQKDRITMSSLEIAELTGKDHADVLKDIRRILLEAEIDEGKFSGVYKGKNGQDRPLFNLPRRECDLIIAGYSVKYRLAIIDRWQELETKTTSNIPDFTNPVAAARAWADEVEKKQLAIAENEANKPKVEFAMSIRNLDGTCSVRDFAKVIGTGQNRLFETLRNSGYLMQNNQPYQKYIDKGLFEVIENEPFTDRKGKSYPTFQTRITGKGQVALEKRFRKEPKNGLVLIQGSLL